MRRTTYGFSSNLHEKLFSFKRDLDYFGPRNCINAYVVLEDDETVGSNSDL